MNKLFSDPSYKAKIGYSGFPMRQRVKFTSTTGELLPIYFDLLQPGDKVRCSETLKSRTLPLKSPVMCSLTEKFDWFFVPMEQIFKLFGSWFFRIDDHSSSIFDFTTLYDAIPHVLPADLKTAADSMKNQWSYFSSAVLNSFRVSECLGIPMLAISNAQSNVQALQPMFACAYQKIYFDYYRLPDREMVDPEAFNLDKWYNTGHISSAAAAKMFTMRYHPWKKDFFTSIKISPIFGQGSMSGIAQNASQNIDNVSKLFHQWLTVGTDGLRTANYSGNLTDGESGNSNGEPTQVINDFTYDSGEGFIRSQLSPTSIRTSFALQKLLEVTRRAGKHYDAQQLAHFGVKLPNGISGEVSYLGSHSTSMTIGDVVSTAETADAALGQQAGKGFGYLDQKSPIDFTAPCHGILMCIFSVIPDVDYTDRGFNRLHTLINPSDWYRPEFDNLGMQPLFAYQAQFNPTSASANSTVLGWQYRYSELKVKYDRVIGGLAKNRNLAYWTTQNIITGNNYSQFLVSPQFLNPVMELGYSPTTTDPFNSDPLIHECVFNVSKASKMSTYGLESL